MIGLQEVLNFPSIVLNWLKFRLLKTEFVEYPKINGHLVIGGRGVFTAGKNVVINSSHRSNPVGNKSRTSIHIATDGILVLGDNIGISNTLFYVRKSIKVEDDVMIGGGCQIYDTDFHSIKYEDRILNGDRQVKTVPVLIKKGAFIGTSCIILKGVTIGQHSVIAAGSVVVKDIPDDEIWGGNPAKFIKKQY